MLRKFLHTALLLLVTFFSYADETGKMLTRETAGFKKYKK